MKNLFGGEYEEVIEETREIKPKESFFGYSPFALQDAVGERSVKKIWLEYQKLRLEGVEAEGLIHKIIAKVKDMMAINAGADRKSLDIKDFPFNKSKKDLKNWDKESLQKIYTALVEIYHNSRMGGEEIDVALEKILLRI